MSSALNVNASAFVPSLNQAVSNEATQVSKAKKPKQNAKQNSKNRRNRHRKKQPAASNEKNPTSSNTVQHAPEGRRRKSDRGGNRKGRRNQDRRKGEQAAHYQGHERAQADAVMRRDPESAFRGQIMAFPPLVPGPDITKNSGYVTGWSKIALEGQAAEDSRLEIEARERSLLERSMTLTFLSRPNVAETADHAPAAATNDERQCGDVRSEQESEAKLEPKLLVSSRRIGDMSKMRDRWWQVLKEKRARDAEEALLQAHEEQCEDTASEGESIMSEEIDSDELSIGEEQQGVDIDRYEDSPHPLHKAIISNDEDGVRHLLRQHSDDRETIFAPISRRQLGLSISTKLLSDDLLSPIHLAVYLDRPHVLRTLLSDSVLVKAAETLRSSTPLMLAAELSADGCIQQLLSRLGAGALTTKDETRGETAIHYACRAGVPSSTLKILLTWLNGGGQNMQKPLSCCNFKSQTPLHVAAEGAHTHLIEIILQLCSPSLLSRLLRVQDEKKQTPLLAAVAAEASETVMALLMSSSQWVPYPKVGKYSAPGAQVAESKAGPCPLVWAVTLGSMEMMHILLEFSGTDGYDLDAALQAAARSSSPNRVEVVRVLVEAGANPCASDGGIQANSPAGAFSIAASRGDAVVLGLLIDAYRQQLHQQQLTRRQDPKLRKQPESFFRSKEKAEAVNVQASLSDALVRCLWLGWRNMHFECLQAGLVIFKKGTFRDTGFARIKRSIIGNKLKDVDEVCANNEQYVYETDYIHYGDPNKNDALLLGAYDISALNYWTGILMDFPWMDGEDDIQCAWVIAQQRSNIPTHTIQYAAHMETVLFVAEGIIFVAHPWIVERKCAKLAAAIRFAEINEVNAGAPIKIDVTLTPKQCKWLLQHIYSGSLLSGWGPETCEELMELSLVAQEFLCPSLVQECEMRLLSSNISQCFCWSCCLAVRKTDDESAQCLYRVTGPSRALTAKAAINALALSEQIGSFATEEYHIKFWASPKYPSSSDVSFKHAWNHYDCNPHFLTRPFTAAKEAAVEAILLNFSDVLKSESFLNQLSGRFDESDSTESIIDQEAEAQAMLLQLCLEELSGSVMGRLENGLISILGDSHTN